MNKILLLILSKNDFLYAQDSSSLSEAETWTIHLAAFIRLGRRRAGYVLAPVTEGASLSFIPIGKTVENGGSFINTVLDVSDGKIGKATVNMATTLAFGRVGKN